MGSLGADAEAPRADGGARFGAGRAGAALVGLVAGLAGAEPYGMFLAMVRDDAVADLFASVAKGVVASGEALRGEGRLSEAGESALAALAKAFGRGGVCALGALKGEFAAIARERRGGDGAAPREGGGMPESAGSGRAREGAGSAGEGSSSETPGGGARACAACGGEFGREALDEIAEWGERFHDEPGLFVCPDCLDGFLRLDPEDRAEFLLNAGVSGGRRLEGGRE
jgi:hypothetical protein